MGLLISIGYNHIVNPLYDYKNKAPGGLSPGARASVSNGLKNTCFQAAISLIFLAHSSIFYGFLHH